MEPRPSPGEKFTVSTIRRIRLRPGRFYERKSVRLRDRNGKTRPAHSSSLPTSPTGFAFRPASAEPRRFRRRRNPTR